MQAGPTPCCLPSAAMDVPSASLDLPCQRRPPSRAVGSCARHSAQLYLCFEAGPPFFQTVLLITCRSLPAGASATAPFADVDGATADM
jgi:hypothetical protein